MAGSHGSSSPNIRPLSSLDSVPSGISILSISTIDSIHIEHATSNEEIDEVERRRRLPRNEGIKAISDSSQSISSATWDFDEPSDEKLHSPEQQKQLTVAENDKILSLPMRELTGERVIRAQLPIHTSFDEIDVVAKRSTYSPPKYTFRIVNNYSQGSTSATSTSAKSFPAHGSQSDDGMKQYSSGAVPSTRRLTSRTAEPHIRTRNHPRIPSRYESQFHNGSETPRESECVVDGQVCTMNDFNPHLCTSKASTGFHRSSDPAIHLQSPNVMTVIGDSAAIVNDEGDCRKQLADNCTRTSEFQKEKHLAGARLPAVLDEGDGIKQNVHPPCTNSRLNSLACTADHVAFCFSQRASRIPAGEGDQDEFELRMEEEKYMGHVNNGVWKRKPFSPRSGFSSAAVDHSAQNEHGIALQQPARPAIPLGTINETTRFSTTSRKEPPPKTFLERDYRSVSSSRNGRGFFQTAFEKPRQGKTRWSMHRRTGVEQARYLGGDFEEEIMSVEGAAAFHNDQAAPVKHLTKSSMALASNFHILTRKRATSETKPSASLAKSLRFSSFSKGKFSSRRFNLSSRLQSESRARRSRRENPLISSNFAEDDYIEFQSNDPSSAKEFESPYRPLSKIIPVGRKQRQSKRLSNSSDN
jgi:hypothetical protein